MIDFYIFVLKEVKNENYIHIDLLRISVPRLLLHMFQLAHMKEYASDQSRMLVTDL